ncbi:MAG TPA: hypothetical protein VKT82_03885 [Ktedonobacterales bacterium]|nr:hypothetical protein [Ktedonobacterales bacterium]
MVGPEAIVQQVWQQVVPTDWKILRGRRRSAFAVGIRAAAWTCAALVLLTLAAVVLRAAPVGRSSPLADVPATFAGYPTLAVVGAAVVALALLVGLSVVITVAIRNAGDHDPLIVLLPQGFVEYANRRKPTIGVLYAALASVEYRGQNARQRRGRLWLALFFKDGRKERWRPRADFGPPARLFEAITKAHALYHVLHDGGQ